MQFQVIQYKPMIFLQKKGLLLLVLITLCLITGALAQRGGGRSRSRSRSSSSRSFRFRSRTKTPTNCTTVDGKTTCYDDDTVSAQEVGLVASILIFLVGGVVVYDKFIKPDRQTQTKKSRESVMNDFVAAMEQQPSTLDLGAREEIIGTLKAKSFNMVLTTRASNDPIQCRLKVNSLEKINDDLYKIKLSGRDEVGSSRLEGNLVFKGDGIAWKLFKDYDDKRQAGQTDGFEDLFYEGSGRITRMEGKWAYHGHESNPEFSGTWHMVPA